jgi:hypothetical protein
MPAPAGMGALICRGALMVGGPFFLSLSRFLRKEIPFDLSDIVPVRRGECERGGTWAIAVKWVGYGELDRCPDMTDS